MCQRQRHITAGTRDDGPDQDRHTIRRCFGGIDQNAVAAGRPLPERNDDKYMKTTMAEIDGTAPKITYKEIDTSLVKPVKRDYSGGAPKVGEPKAAQVEGAH